MQQRGRESLIGNRRQQPPWQLSFPTPQHPPERCFALVHARQLEGALEVQVHGLGCAAIYKGSRYMK